MPDTAAKSHAREPLEVSEEARRAALADYGILDSEPEAAFDDLVHLAAQICGTPIAAISFLDTDRQWFKAEIGLGVSQTEMGVAFCAHAATGGSDVFVVHDATTDPRFAANRLVTDSPGVRFYAGAPIRTVEGVVLGTVCVLDPDLRQLSDPQRDALGILARQAMALLEARRISGQLAAAARQREAALKAAAAASEQLRVVFNHVGVGLLITDASRRVTEANAAFARMVGREPEALVGTHVADLGALEEADAEAEVMAQLFDSDSPTVIREKRYRHADGHLVVAVSTTALIRGEDGSIQGALSQVQSIEDRRRAEASLLETQSALDAIVTTDAEGRVISWNAGAKRLFGHDAVQMVGRHLEGLLTDGAGPAGPLAVLANAASTAPGALEFEGIRDDGTSFPIELTLSAWTRAGKRRYTAVIRDVSERNRLSEELLAQASRDPLTGLANRSSITSRLAELLARPDPVSVLAIDVDGFGTLNDALGPAIADGLLVDVGRRLVTALRPGDYVARIGSDTFVVVLPGARHGTASGMAKRLQVALSQPTSVRDIRLQITATIGLVTHLGVIGPVRASAIATKVLRNASLALTAARRDGPGGIGVYRPAMYSQAKRRVNLHADLVQAIDTGELTLAYQPQIDLATDRVVGFEALARWNHPSLGAISPVEFIALAEDTGLIPQIGDWALDEACRQATTWPHRVGVSVNASALQFAGSGITGSVQAALARSGLAPARLTLEVTESVLANNTYAVAHQLGALRALGIRISVDDFGTGYSNLASLTHLPIDELKIDRAFVSPLPGDDSTRRIVATIIALAQGLGLHTVAEGIETTDQNKALCQLGCAVGQGFLYAKPMAVDQLPSWLGSPLQVVRWPDRQDEVATVTTSTVSSMAQMIR